MASHRDLTDEAERWAAPNAGLALFLNALRARLGLLILISAGTLAARAAGASSWPRFAAPALGVPAALLGVTMMVALARHLGHPRSNAGGLLGAVAAIGLAGGALIDVYAVVLTGGLTAPPSLLASATPLTIALLAELVAFASLAPLALSEARLAGALGALDVRRRASSAAALVAASAALMGGLVEIWARLPPNAALALASGAGLLVVLSLAKVLGATRYLLAYLKTMHIATSSPAPLELRAWHRA